jgi:hypothetical protein
MNNPIVKKEIRANILILLFVLATVIIFVSYLATHFTGETGIKSDKGIAFCQPENAPPDQQKCFFTAHWHVHADIKICSEPKILSYETGDLEKLHTHVETNKVHWHGLLQTDPITKEITDYSQMKMSNLFAELKVPVANNGIYNFKNGDTCPDGRTGNLEVLVNGQDQQDFLNYILKDGDHISIEF